MATAGRTASQKAAKSKDLPVVAYDMVIRSRKNKTGFTAPVMRAHVALADTDTLRAGHVDTARDLVRLGLSLGIVEKRAAVYDLFGESYRGGDALRQALRDNEDIHNQLYRAVLKEAVGDDKYAGIEAASFFEKVKKAGKGDSGPSWRKNAAGKRK